MIYKGFGFWGLRVQVFVRILVLRVGMLKVIK